MSPVIKLQRRWIVAVALALATSGAACAQTSPAAQVDHDQLQSRLQQGEKLVVLDVRTAEEFAAGHVPGARNIPHDVIAARIAELDDARGSEIVVYCRSGRRSQLAIETLTERGFTRVAHLSGDFLGWQAANRPVETALAIPAAPVEPAAPAQPATPDTPPAP
jgi:rhodanese-related sulfurtransferase